jgi:flagellar basal-body rod protein FlgB
MKGIAMLNMQQALGQSAQASGSTANGMSKTSELHMQSAAGNTASEPLFRPVIQGSVDGNSVDMDVERNQFVDNGLRYEASLNMINGQIKKMLTAIQGQ